jgi:dephospho-CoA kinase
MAKIVVVNGMPMSGKSQFVEYCLQELGFYGEEVSTVDFVKELATLAGWDGVKRPKDRKFLSDLKDLLVDWNDVPFKKIVEARDRLADHLDYLGYDANMGVVFTHCREPEEIQKFVDRENAITVLLRREAVENYKQSNHADANVFNYKYDYVIDNNGNLEELREKAKGFLELIKT